MAGSKTDLLENEVLRLMTGQSLGTLSFPVTPYLALFTVVPTDAAGGTEVTGSSYARQSGVKVGETTTTAGAFSTVWPDDTVELYCVVREDDTHVGRSGNEVPA